MDLTALTAKATEALAGGVDFDNKVKFDFGDAGKLLIDGAAKSVTNDDSEADVTISVGFDDFLKLAKGKLDPKSAFIQGRLKVAGDIGLVMKLQSLFSELA